MQRRFLLKAASAASISFLNGCGGGSGDDTASQTAAVTPAPSAQSLSMSGGYNAASNTSVLLSQDGSLTFWGTGSIDDAGFAFTQVQRKTADGTVVSEQLTPTLSLVSTSTGAQFLLDSSEPDLTVIQAFENGQAKGVFGAYRDSTYQYVGVLPDLNHTTRADLTFVQKTPLAQITASITRRVLFAGRSALQSIVEGVIPRAAAQSLSDEDTTIVAFATEKWDEVVTAGKEALSRMGRGWTAVAGVASLTLAAVTESLLERIAFGGTGVGLLLYSANAFGSTLPTFPSTAKNFSLKIGDFTFSGSGSLNFPEGPCTSGVVVSPATGTVLFEGGLFSISAAWTKDVAAARCATFSVTDSFDEAAFIEAGKYEAIERNSSADTTITVDVETGNGSISYVEHFDGHTGGFTGNIVPVGSWIDSKQFAQAIANYLKSLKPVA